MNLDRFRKLEEYKTVPSLAYILLLDTTGRRSRFMCAKALNGDADA